MAEPSRFKKKVHFGGTRLSPDTTRAGVRGLCSNARSGGGGAAGHWRVSGCMCLVVCHTAEGIVYVAAPCLRWTGPVKTPSHATGPGCPSPVRTLAAFPYSEESL